MQPESLFSSEPAPRSTSTIDASKCFLSAKICLMKWQSCTERSVKSSVPRSTKSSESSKQAKMRRKPVQFYWQQIWQLAESIFLMLIGSCNSTHHSGQINSCIESVELLVPADRVSLCCSWQTVKVLTSPTWNRRPLSLKTSKWCPSVRREKKTWRKSCKMWCSPTKTSLISPKMHSSASSDTTRSTSCSLSLRSTRWVLAKLPILSSFSSCQELRRS